MKQFAKKFKDFINEAYVDAEGKLKDFEISDDDSHRFEMQDYMMTIVDYLKDAGAKDIDPDYFEGMMKFPFKKDGESYEMFIDLDLNHSTLMKYASPLSKGETIYDGPTDAFIDLLIQYGLTFL